MNRKLVLGLCIFIAIVLAVSILPYILPSSDAIDVGNMLSSPSLSHIAGTDALGRDILSRTLYGGRTSLFIGGATALLSALIGASIGIMAVSVPRLDGALMALTDLMKAVPSTLLAVLFMCLLGPGTADLIIALTVINIPQIARLVRSRMLLIRKEEYTLARISLGLGGSTMVKSYIRHLMPVLLIQIAFTFASSILAESALSFIGAGVLPPAPSWGNILSEGRSVIFSSWYVLVAPSLLILLTVLSLNLIGEGLSAKLEKESPSDYS